MTFATHTGRRALSAALAIGLGLSASPGRAAYVVTLDQDGSEVIATGSGSIDTASFIGGFVGAATANVYAAIGEITTGPLISFTVASFLAPLSGPTSFGSGGLFPPTSGSGDLVGLQNGADLSVVYLPAGYVSGDMLSGTSTYVGQSLSSLGVTPGTYVWTWGTPGVDADSFTLIAAIVPEPSTWAMLLLGFAALGWAGLRKAKLMTAAVR
jgi:PEP-CTERM motif